MFSGVWGRWVVGLAPRGVWPGGSAGRCCARRERGEWMELSRGRAMGDRVSTFLCSLRPDPLPPG